MANEILARQPTAYAQRIEVPFEDALKVVLEPRTGDRRKKGWSR